MRQVRGYPLRAFSAPGLMAELGGRRPFAAPCTGFRFTDKADRLKGTKPRLFFRSHDETPALGQDI